MGLDVAAISRAQFVDCDGDEQCDDGHIGVGSYRKRRDGLKPGCYVVGKGGRSFGFRAGSYFGYNNWRRQLSLLGLGVEPEDVWANPRRFRAKPFVELIDFPDGVGPVIGPKTSAKLHGDFVAFATKAKKFYKAQPLPVPSKPPKRKKAKRNRSINQAGLSFVEEFSSTLGGVAGIIENEDRTWMWDLYRDFRRAFKLASNRGFVLFS